MNERQVFLTERVLSKVVWLDAIEAIAVAAFRPNSVRDGVVLVQEEMGEDKYRLESESKGLVASLDVVSHRFV